MIVLNVTYKCKPGMRDLVEKWRDADALTKHAAQPHFKRLGELKNSFVNDTIIEKFEK